MKSCSTWPLETGFFFPTQHNTLEVHPNCCIYQSLVSFYCWLVFHCMDIPVCLTICLWKDIWVFSPCFWLLQIELVCYHDINVATPFCFFFKSLFAWYILFHSFFQTVSIIIFEVDFLWIVYGWIMFAFEKIHYAHLCLLIVLSMLKTWTLLRILFWLT